MLDRLSTLLAAAVVTFGAGWLVTQALIAMAGGPL